jgi:phosphoglycolate phosphatase
VAPLILFDIDGTLLKPGDLAHQQALLDAIEDVHGVRASLEGVPLGGMLDSQIVRIALERTGVSLEVIRAGQAQVMQRMGERYVELLGSDDRVSWLLPGVVTLIDRMVSDFTLSVLTGNASGVARAKLEAAGIARYFQTGAFGDSADHRHELVPVAVERASQITGVTPQPGQVVLIGDTPRDIEAAKASGSRVLAVATGRYGVEELADHEPDLVFATLEDVDQVYAAVRDLTAS